MRWPLLLAALITFAQPVRGQSPATCGQNAWGVCPDILACAKTRAALKAACRLACEHDLAQIPTSPLTKNLRADELACVTTSQDRGLVCQDSLAWRLSEISARADAFDYAIYEYPYLTKLTVDEIVDTVYRVAERGFIAQGGCVTTSQGRSVTLLYTTALALNRIRGTGAGSVKWEQAQALSLEWLRARRGY